MSFVCMCTFAIEAKKERAFEVSIFTVSEIHHIHCYTHEFALFQLVFLFGCIWL